MDSFPTSHGMSNVFRCSTKLTSSIEDENTINVQRFGPQNLTHLISRLHESELPRSGHLTAENEGFPPLNWREIITL
jgi:hypothetical protein